MMMIVDAQIHLWQGAAAPSHHRSAPYLAEEAIREMDMAGVAGAINCPAIWDTAANDYADTVALAHPDRFATMGWFALERSPDEAFVRSFLAKPGMIGLRFVIMRPDDVEALGRGGLDWIWRVAEEMGKPVALMVPKPTLPVVGGVAERFPGLRILIDHLAIGPFEKLPEAADHLAALTALAAIPNVSVRATATPSMSNEHYPFKDTHTVLERVYQAYGPDRMFWGTDITRMHVSLRECVTMFTEDLPWLKGADLDRVMGTALCDWVDWRPR